MLAVGTAPRAPMQPVLLLALFLFGPGQAQSPDLPPHCADSGAAEGLCALGQEDELEAARRLLQEGKLAEAQRAFEELVAKDPDNPWARFLLGYTVHARASEADDPARRTRLLERALQLHLDASAYALVRPTAFYNAACACALLERKEDAFRYLDLAFESGFESRGMLLRDPDLESLRDDPRFEAYLPTEPLAPFAGEVRILHAFYGEEAGDQFGWSGRNAGDCDGDGFADVVVSAPFKAVGGAIAGRVYVFSGASGELLFAHSGEPGAKLGTGVEAAGDVNADGHADVVCGAPGTDSRPGQVLVLSGLDGSVLARHTSDEPGDRFGARVAGVGDADGDGVPDLFVGAPGSGAAGDGAGRAYLISGADGSTLATLEGERAGDGFGSSVAGVAGSGTVSLAVGASSAGRAGHGRAYVFDYDQGQVELRYVFNADRTGGHLGRMFVSFLGDVDGDGTSDLYVSDWENNARGYKTGRVYVRSGVNGAELLTLTGPHAGSGFGSGPGVAGDLDGDGLADLVVGAWRSSRGAAMAGTCSLYSGLGELLGEFVCTLDNEAFGFDAAGLGDLDGDGAVDFLVTAAWSSVHGKRSGRAWILAGPKPARDEPKIEKAAADGD